jgi:DNA repair exonuclease SbcCD nuclease subunit
MYATMFVDTLVGLCRMKNATLVLLHGTESHDAKQLKLFYHYLQDYTVDIRIVEQTKFEYIKGAKCLCIPEEYGKGTEYYNEYLYNSGLYDTVFMHGAIKGSIYGANEEDLDSVKAPVFSIDSFGMCTGPIIAGHVHVAGCYAGYMYYNGSPIRWCFGEEQEKGFMIVLHNLDTHEHYAHFEPIQSFRYDTINLDYMVQDDPKNVIEYVKGLQAQGIDNIRIEFTYGEDDFLDIIKNYFKNNSSVKIKAETASVKQQIKQAGEVEERYKQYDYIFDSGMNEYDILTRYINQNKGYTYITTDELISILKEI